MPVTTSRGFEKDLKKIKKFPRHFPNPLLLLRRFASQLASQGWVSFASDKRLSVDLICTG